MRPQTGQEKIRLLCFLLPSSSPHTAVRALCYRKEGNQWGPQHLPETDALASLGGACESEEGGQTDAWIRLCMEQTPRPLPFFELLVTVFAAEAPAFPGYVRHVFPATGITVAHAFCCWQLGLLRHI